MELKVKSNPEIEGVFSNYPQEAREKVSHLRELIIETAGEIEGLASLEETLKWGEPSYLTKNGSTIRIDWKEKSPKQYAMYFKCTSKLVPTFRFVYGDLFQYEGNRAIVFGMNDPIPEIELKKCISAALSYHKVKQLPELGMV